VNPVLPTNQWLWDAFKEEFNYTFEDTTAKQRAEKKLTDLCMAPNKLDIYIMNFKDLV
jgi:Retrotransposon gag protein